jgi:hypothetical protein
MEDGAHENEGWNVIWDSLDAGSGRFATMLALGMFTSSPAEAKHITSGSNDATSTTAAALPNDPGAATQMTLTFVTNT